MSKTVRECAAKMWQAWQDAEDRNIDEDVAEWEDIMRDCRVWYVDDPAIFADKINSVLAYNDKSYFIEVATTFLTNRPIIGD